MNIYFGQISSVPGADFGLSGMLLKLLRERLDGLHKEIKFFKDKFKGEEFSIVFIISATRDKTSVEAKGPAYLRKKKEIEFAVYIPYKEITDFNEKVAYVLNHLTQGIISVLNRYETDSTGIEETIREVVRIVQADPDAFQYK